MDRDEVIRLLKLEKHAKEAVGSEKPIAARNPSQPAVYRSDTQVNEIEKLTDES